MRRLLVLVFVIAGCDCGSTGGDPCSVTADCDDGFVCIDSLCQRPLDSPGTDSAFLDVPRPDVPGVDVPGVDTNTDTTCGGENIAFEYQPPNVLLILDRSCSMRRRLDDDSMFGTGPDDERTRWATGRDAVLGLMSRFGSRVYWGLMAYPDPREACDDTVSAEVLPGPGTVGMIGAELARDAIQPFGLCGPDNSDTTTQPRQTPTSRALEAAEVLPTLMDPTRDNFAIVITDGGESCVADGMLTAVSGRLLAAGVPVAVVGFTTGVSESSLEAIAAAGGLVNPAGPPSYYVADDAASLDAVFDELAARIVSCELTLSSVPPDPSMLFVTANDDPLDEDPVDGWSYDESANTLRLNGAACDDLRIGVTTRLGVGFGCPPEECLPQDEICNGLDEDCDDMVDEGVCLI